MGCLASCFGLVASTGAQAGVPQVDPAQTAGIAEKVSRAVPFPFPMVTPEPVRFPRWVDAVQLYM